MKPSTSFLDLFKTNRQASAIISYVLISLMMACVGYGLSQALINLFPGMQLSYLPWVCFFISLEVLYTQQIVRNSLDTNARWISRISEWLVIAIFLKVLWYLLNGFDRLVPDIMSWQQNFLLNFFTEDYILPLLIIYIIWGLSFSYLDNVNRLHNIDEVVEWDQLSIQHMDLQRSHQELIARVIIIGFVLVVTATLNQISARFKGQTPTNFNGPIAAVITYFGLGFVLLSYSRLALLRTRWWISKTKFSPKLANNWLKYTAIFFGLLAILSFVLPTQYTYGLLDVLKVLLGILITIIQFIFISIAFLFGLIMSLLFKKGQTQPEEQAAPQMPTPNPQPVVTNTPIPWLEMVKSIIFWVVLIGIIGFAVIQYLRQNRNLAGYLKQIPFLLFLGNAWRELWAWLRKTNKKLANSIITRIKQITSRRTSGTIESIYHRIFNWRGASPRQKIIFLYLRLVKIGSEHGLERKESQTPYQYEANLRKALAEAGQDIDNFTDAFIQARYTRHEIDDSNSNQAQNHWKRIIARIRSWQKK